MVEDLEQGVLAARGPDGEWISVTTALQLRRPVLGRRVLWVPFLPADFRERRRQRLEDLQRRRVLDGKSKYLVQVTPTPPLARVVPMQSMDDAPRSTASTTLPARLRAARLAAGLSQREFGRVFGVSATSVCNWERGFVEDEHGHVRGKRMSATHRAAVEQWLAARDG